jgi:hypothetical protein
MIVAMLWNTNADMNSVMTALADQNGQVATFFIAAIAADMYLSMVTGVSQHC